MLKQVLAQPVAIALTGCNSSNEQVDSNVSVQNKSQVSYPDTRKDNVVDTYFGQQVADPYRWLEDDMSAETAEWVKAQNNTTFDYLANIPYCDQIKETLTEYRHTI